MMKVQVFVRSAPAHAQVSTKARERYNDKRMQNTVRTTVGFKTILADKPDKVLWPRLGSTCCRKYFRKMSRAWMELEYSSL
jgi:hypothetical protein